MKAVKINAKVNLSNGIQMPEGSIVILAEGYANIKNEKDGFIPVMLSSSVFLDEQSYLDGKDVITGISDFNPVFDGLQLTVSNYETVPCEPLLLNVLKSALDAVYGPDNIEIINIDRV